MENIENINSSKVEIQSGLLYTRNEVASLLGVKVTTLEKWVSLKDGPNIIKVGRLVRYSGEDLLAYLKSQRVSFSESDND